MTIAASRSRSEPVWKGAYRRLRQSILSRELAPSTRLIELDLAAGLGISRTPLREALTRLELDGLIQPNGAGGYFVADMSRDLVDSYHLRAAIECSIARLAAERITRVEVAILRDNVEASQKLHLSDHKARADANADFHRGLAEAAKSPKLLHAFSNLADLLLTDEDLSRHSLEARDQFLRDHALILGVVEIGDADSAERLMRRHLFAARDVLISRIKIHVEGIAR